MATRKPKLYSKEDTYNIVDYDDEDFLEKLYSRDGGFDEDYEMWMARKKHDRTWTDKNEATEKKRRKKIITAFTRFRRQDLRERALDQFTDAAAKPRPPRSGRPPGAWHRKTGRPFPLVGRVKTLMGRGRRTRRRRRRRTRRRQRGGKFIVGFIRKKIAESPTRKKHHASTYIKRSRKRRKVDYAGQWDSPKWWTTSRLKYRVKRKKSRKKSSE